MTKYEYWKQMLAESLGEHGFNYTEEMISSLAADVTACHEGFSQAFPSPDRPKVIRNEEAERLREELEREKDLVECPQCFGSGLTPVGVSHMGTCTYCDGNGHVPSRWTEQFK